MTAAPDGGMMTACHARLHCSIGSGEEFAETSDVEGVRQSEGDRQRRPAHRGRLEDEDAEVDDALLAQRAFDGRQHLRLRGRRRG